MKAIQVFILGENRLQFTVLIPIKNRFKLQKWVILEFTRLKYVFHLNVQN